LEVFPEFLQGIVLLSLIGLAGKDKLKVYRVDHVAQLVHLGFDLSQYRVLSLLALGIKHRAKPAVMSRCMEPMNWSADFREFELE